MNLAFRILTLALVSLAVWIAASGLWIGVIGWAATPLYDQWDDIAPEQLARILLSPHNEHRIILSRLTFWIDLWLAHGTGVLTIALVYLFNAADWVVLVLLALWSWPEAGRTRQAAGAAAAAALFFSGFQFENFVAGFQNQFTGVFFFASAAIAALAFGAQQPVRLKWIWIAASMTSASLSVACMANGLLLVLLLPVLALALRLPVAALGYGLLAVVTWSLYMTGYPAASSGLLTKLANHPVAFAVGLLEYLGGALPNSITLILAPFKYATALAGVFGAAALGGIAVIAARAAPRPWRARPQLLAWIMIAAFVISSAAVTALGRGDMGGEAMLANRYGAGTALLWAILALWLIIATPQRWSTPAMAAAIPAVLLLSYGQLFWFGGAQTFKHKKLDAEAALLSGADTPSIYRQAYPDPSRVPTVAISLRAQSIAMFSEPWRRLFGTRLTIASPADCRAQVLGVKFVAEAADPTWRASITGAFPSATRAIAVTDDDKKVVGLLIRGMTGDRSIEAFGWRHPAVWSGFARVNAAAAAQSPLFAFAVDDEGRGICRLDQRIAVNPLDIIKLVPAQQVGPALSGLEVSSEGRFVENGQHETVKVVPFGGRAWASWAGSDENTGRLTLRLNVQGNRRIALPVVTGPGPTGTKLEVKADGRTILLASDPVGFDAWAAIALEVPRGAKTLEIIATDASKNWGGWIGVGEPHQLCDGPCLAVDPPCPTPAELEPNLRSGFAGWVDAAKWEGDQVVLSGWAADLSARTTSIQVVAVAKGRVLGCVRPDQARADVAKAVGLASLAHSGFALKVPKASVGAVEFRARQADNHFFPLNMSPLVPPR